MSVFVIADAHGNADQVRGLLEQEGLPRPGVAVVQLGDLANCVGDSEADDLEALDLVGGPIDLMLVGNHEHPHFGGPAFSGFWPHLTVKHRLHRLNAAGLIQPSFVVPGHGHNAGILVTHAGVTSAMNEPTHPEEGPWTTAEDADEELRWAWHSDPRYRVFSAIGPERGGRDGGGGILWADWREPKTPLFRQLVGHTVGRDIRRKWRATCIDLGGGKGDRIAGAWIVNGRIRVVVHEREQAVAA